MYEIWKNFKGRKWKKAIDVPDFIRNNYTPYEGGAEFLQGPTARTLAIRAQLEDLLLKEQEKGGVLDVATDRISSLLTFEPGYVDREKDVIVGLQTDQPLRRAVNPFGGIRMAVKACEEYGYKLGDSVLNEFKYKTTHNDGVFRVYSDEMKSARRSGVITGLPDSYGRGRIIGDYRRVALYGMNFLIEQKKRDKASFQQKPMTDANIRLIEDLARQLEFMDQLKEMANSYGYDISFPAKDALEAVQWLYFGYLGAVKEQNGAANSIGRITTFLDIYFERDIARGALTEQRAQEIFDDFIVKMRLVRHLRTSEYNDLFAGDPTWVTMSEAGLCNDGRHMVTKSAYRVLQTLYNLGPSSEPNITILWSQELPQNYKNFCAKVSIDTDSIQYENDDIMRPEFSDDYAIACCVSAMKTGKQMQFFGARCNLAKLLLMSLNGGRDEISGEQIAPAGEVFDEGVLDFEKVYAAYKKYSKWMATLYVNTMNVIHYMHDKYAYERLMMSLHDTDVERLMAFGVSGLSVLADSLSALKHATVRAVKDERGLITEFVTDGDFPKFGNDDDRVDSLAQEVLSDFFTNLKAVKPYRNARHTLSVLTITSNVVYGKKTGATPDGRKMGEPFAPGANPMHGRDTQGALASLNSVAKLCYSCCQDGISNTFTVLPKILGDDEQAQVERLTTVIDGYFAQAAHHLNVNVLNRERLLDAMENPKLYPNLTIRVSGYAVNFNKLSREQQLEVVSRTFHEKM